MCPRSRCRRECAGAGDLKLTRSAPRGGTRCRVVAEIRPTGTAQTTWPGARLGQHGRREDHGRCVAQVIGLKRRCPRWAACSPLVYRPAEDAEVRAVPPTSSSRQERPGAHTGRTPSMATAKARRPRDTPQTCRPERWIDRCKARRAGTDRHRHQIHAARHEGDQERRADADRGHCHCRQSDKVAEAERSHQVERQVSQCEKGPQANERQGSFSAPGRVLRRQLLRPGRSGQGR